MSLNETYSKSHAGKFLSDKFPTQNDPKERDALPPLLFNFAIECAISKVQENEVISYWFMLITLIRWVIIQIP
jgi:hypothetical protein